eukprot:TRINITY_DN33539_c0_g1_i4.p1 TRINITY_DN33539_c0_g1~~TRINITY_DN33539_c0_g1_i4.p1  ORF type:complete len:168 (-),score=32.38 TRINITY_DN33539_c0_g1_i4:42-545(-)
MCIRDRSYILALQNELNSELYTKYMEQCLDFQYQLFSTKIFLEKKEDFQILCNNYGIYCFEQKLESAKVIKYMQMSINCLQQIKPVAKEKLLDSYMKTIEILQTIKTDLGNQELKNQTNEAIKLLESDLSLIHISEPTRLGMISYAVFCLKKKRKSKENIIKRKRKA